MAYRTKVRSHTRRRPVKKEMRELFEKLGMKPEVTIDSHERNFTRRRSQEKKVEEDKEDKEEK